MVVLSGCELPCCFRGDAAIVQQLFPSSPRFSRLLFTPLDVSGDGHTVVSDNKENISDSSSSYSSDSNVLTKAIFEEIWNVARQVSTAICYPVPRHLAMRGIRLG